ncbi:hypothetical protein [Nesterenkonia alkaliphila]|uniref:Uncharacterized protein n=1 Tax=Nesterenkonia alkaliphila TaxID=1463631 RepID=A0A7K1ULQ4_9MICC|nr:hypothetical protein [Nesterenkonia alkaliphila]MVT26961.1 hypothetical protein [Nesterenkonia alkaliphila]GFZ90329.1 hypothetical protein GCM10011359_19660 [Nesterenkonia alkaliphila]
MTRRKLIDRAAEQMIDIEHISLPDERERSVYLEAKAFNGELTILGSLALALVAAVFGYPAATIALFLLLALTAGSTGWYAKRRGVDEWELQSRGPLARTLTWTGVHLALGFGAWAAMLYHLIRGEALVPFLFEVEVAGRDLQNFMLTTGLIVTGIGFIASLAAMAVMVLHHRRRARLREAAEDEE